METNNPNLTRLVRETLYQTKKEWGVPVSLYRATASATDYETGEKTMTKTSIDVRLCPVLPMTSVRKFVQSVSYLAASKSFASAGGQGWDQGTRGFVFDARDLPIGHIIEVEDWIVYRGRRYDPKQIEELGHNLGWFVIATEIRGANPEQIIKANVSHVVGLEQSAEETES